MQKTWTIAVDIDDNPHSTYEQNLDEMEYWEGIIEAAVQVVLHTYDKQVDQEADRLDYAAFDFTSVTVTREG